MNDNEIRAMLDTHERAMARLSTPGLAAYAEVLAPEQMDFFSPFEVGGIQYLSYDEWLLVAPSAELVAMAHHWEAENSQERTPRP